MALSPVKSAAILGLQVQGDLGPFTTYTQFKGGKRSIVLFPKIWLSDPTTLKQLNHRNRIRAAARQWQRLTANDRLQWMTASRRLSFAANGYAIWTWWQMKRDESSLKTIERQSGITLRRDP